MAQRRERRFVEGFAQRWMGVNGERDVFEARAHFERERKSGRELRDALADGLDSEHDMVVGARDDPHEAVVVLERHGAAISAERKMANANFAMRGLGGVRREPYGHDLGIGEADRWNGDVIEGAL